MKFKKIGLYITVFIISLFIINTNIKAFENTYNITYDFIYNNIILKAQEKNIDFDFKVYNNFYCHYTYEGRCYFFKEDDLNKFSIKRQSDSASIFSYSETFNYYYISFSLDLSINNCIIKDVSTISNHLSDNYYHTNMSLDKDLPNFIYLDSGLDEEIPEPEINIKATNLLNFIIDKAKNIYEVLINNEIFKFILSIPLIYLCFLAIYKLISNRR